MKRIAVLLTAVFLAAFAVFAMAEVEPEVAAADASKGAVLAAKSP